MTNVGTKAIFRTNKNAPNFKLIAIDLLDYKEDKWTELLPEHPDNVLDWATAVDGDKFVACYIQDVKVSAFKYIYIYILLLNLNMLVYKLIYINFQNILQLHSLTTGKVLRTFPLDVGTIVGFSGDKKYSEIFFQFTSFLTPGIIYMTDLKNDDEPKVSINNKCILDM